jgi:hypothetical protein
MLNCGLFVVTFLALSGATLLCHYYLPDWNMSERLVEHRIARTHAADAAFDRGQVCEDGNVSLSKMALDLEKVRAELVWYPALKPPHNWKLVGVEARLKTAAEELRSLANETALALPSAGKDVPWQLARLGPRRRLVLVACQLGSATYLEALLLVEGRKLVKDQREHKERLAVKLRDLKRTLAVIRV